MKLNLLYALSFALVIASCSKDDDAPTFKQEDLIGAWSRTSTTVEQDGDCDGEELEFTTATITQTTICDGTAAGSFEYAYTYASNTATIEEFGITQQMVVTSLNATTLKIDWKIEGQKVGSSTYEKL
jgi:hypothetical protein